MKRGDSNDHCHPPSVSNLSYPAAWMRRPFIKGFESPLICPSGSLDFVLDALMTQSGHGLDQQA
jgi:hypothetical protein